MLHFARVLNTTLLQCCIQPWRVGDKFSGGRGAFVRCSRDKQNLTGLIRIFYKRNSCEASTRLPAWRRWYIGGCFLRTLMFITDEFRFGLGVEHKPKVKLVAEQR